MNPIEKLNSDEKGEKLKQLIDPFILRRTKDMVAKELPPISEQVLYCDMTEEQTRFYEKEKSSIRNLLLKAIEETGVNKNAILALQALTKLRQIANHPVFVDANYKGSSGKYEQIFDVITSYSIHYTKLYEHQRFRYQSRVLDFQIVFPYCP